jgi:hypothetical protein
MSIDQRPYGPAQQFILNQMDMLLARFEQLGRQIRDIVSRIIGTTVAEAVSEAIRAATRMVPQRRALPERENWRQGDRYAPYEGDEEDYYPRDQYASYDHDPVQRTRSDWRGVIRGVIRLMTAMFSRLKSWPATRWVVIGSATMMDVILLAPPRPTSDNSWPG